MLPESQFMKWVRLPTSSGLCVANNAWIDVDGLRSIDNGGFAFVETLVLRIRQNDCRDLPSVRVNLDSDLRQIESGKGRFGRTRDHLDIGVSPHSHRKLFVA